MRIGELARLTGIPRTSIHFYIRQGLLHPPVKTSRTMAYYDESHLKRLRAIKAIKKNMRLPLIYIKDQIEKVEQQEELSAETDRQIAASEKYENDPKGKRKQIIIKAAITIFSQKGYHRTKIQDISKAAGISTGTFYLYFENKRELFTEVADEVIKAIMGEGADAIRQERDIAQRMRIRGQVFFNNYSKYNEILYQLRAEISSGEEWAQEKVKKVYQNLTEPVIRDIQKCIRQGLYRELDPDLLAYILTGQVEIMALRMKIDSKYTLEEIRDFLRDFNRYGLNIGSNIPG
jgi:AcrR family transcriptional regulator